VTSPPAPPTAGGLENAQTPVDLSLVQELLRLFGKAARAHQLYLPNNPVYKAALDALRAGFRPIWEVVDELALGFTETEVRYAGETVLEEPTRGSDSLPWLFYKDGVRELRLLRGFDTEELGKLLDILQRIRKASPDEDDLLTLLWQGDFVFLRYRYVDMTVEATVPLSEGGEALTDDEGSEEREANQDATGQRVDRDALAAEVEEELESRPGVVSMTDFDATLYFLDEREVEYLQTEIRREYETDLRTNVVALLLDIFEAQPDAAIRDEVADILESFMLHMLAAGQFRNVAFLVRESLVAAQRAPELQAPQRERLSQIPVRLSAPEPLTQLLQSLDEAAELPPAGELLELFEQLRGTGLATVLDWLARLQTPRLRPLVEQAASRLAAQNTAELVKLILSPTRNVALEAIRRAGGLKTPAAVAPLGKILAEGDVQLRAAAVGALAEIGSAGALQALERALDDGEREVRLAAIRALQARAHRPMLPRLEAMVKGRAVREADLSEKMVVFEAYGSLCGEAGVPALDAMLNGKSMFGRREDPELRACAAVALGRVGTPQAQESLRQSASEKDVVVRNAVARALRGGAAS
jgi:HEAT repeat protein